jgi:hypothetical protein
MKFLPLQLLLLIAVCPLLRGAIDREALVRRNSPSLRALDPRNPFSVGNGRFAFTADVTGLQSLGNSYQSPGIPLNTLARWAWYSEPNPHRYTLADASAAMETNGRAVAYPTIDQSPAGEWLRRNPGNYPVGEVGFVDDRGQDLIATDITSVVQKLDLWTGMLTSRFRWKGVAFAVTTLVDPGSDTVWARVVSDALKNAGLRVRVRFPRGYNQEIKNIPPLDWSRPESHATLVIAAGEHSARLARRRDALEYEVKVGWNQGEFHSCASPHAYDLVPATGVFEFSVNFAPRHPGPAADHAARSAVTNFDDAAKAAASFWRGYWTTGAALDLSGSSDPRARELERRVVLSEYLTAIQFDGDVPPSETGLTVSSWYNKHNSEMVWWHVAHFAEWGRPRYVADALDWFQRTLPHAQATARERGLPGARWSKMVGPDGRESPGGNPLIVWNQPHPIYLAELLYRADPTEATLGRWKEIVEQTADCMAGMLRWNVKSGRFDLGPPLWIAQEIYDKARSVNPCYELSYWRFGLETAQTWRVRQGLPRVAAWDRRLKLLAPLPERDGLYVALGSIPDTWENIDSRHDHPSFLMALGQLPGADVNRATMARTFDAVLAQWDWKAKIWGWDYPMIAMTAARLGEPEKAVDVLLSDRPNNHYSLNGHCPQNNGLVLYLPANGALLAAVGLMAGGWDGAPPGPAPGFPRNGGWHVQAEGFQRLP